MQKIPTCCVDLRDSRCKNPACSWPTRAENASNGRKDREHHGGGEPGAKKFQPPCDLLPRDTIIIFLLSPWPAMRAHPSWQRHLASHLFFPLLFFFRRRTQRLLTRLLHVASYLASSRRPHLLDLLIIIEIHPIIISAETIIPRGRADQ